MPLPWIIKKILAGLKMTNEIRILIADDNALVHEGLQAMLATQPDLEVVGVARDGVEAVALAPTCNQK